MVVYLKDFQEPDSEEEINMKDGTIYPLIDEGYYKIFLLRMIS